MKNEQFDYFFNSASKIVVVIPIVVLAIALVFHLDKTKSKMQKAALSQTQAPSRAPTKPKDEPFYMIDINKNYACRDKTRNAYIFKKQFFMESFSKKKTTNYLFDEDCLYVFDKGKYAGEKTCGLGQYVKLAETLTSFGIAKPEGLMSTAIDIINKTGVSANKKTNEEDALKSIKTFIKTCREKKNIDAKFFTVPKNVLFKNKK